MVILLNKQLDCETICERINNLINKELKNIGKKDNLKDYALCITLTKVVEETKCSNLALELK